MIMFGAQTLSLPWPPSVNGYWRNSRGRQIISRAGREYRKAIADRFGGTPTITGEVEVHIVLHPPDRRRRDWDNWHKATCDALAHAGVLGDDCQIRRAFVEFGDIKKPGEYRISIRGINGNLP